MKAGVNNTADEANVQQQKMIVKSMIVAESKRERGVKKSNFLESGINLNDFNV